MVASRANVQVILLRRWPCLDDSQLGKLGLVESGRREFFSPITSCAYVSGIYNFPAGPHGSGPDCRTMSPVLPAFFYLGESWGLTWEVLWNHLCVQRNENHLIRGESRNKNGRLWGSICWKEEQSCDAFGLIVLICFGLARTLEQVFQALSHLPPLYQQH